MQSSKRIPSRIIELLKLKRKELSNTCTVKKERRSLNFYIYILDIPSAFTFLKLPLPRFEEDRGFAGSGDRKSRGKGEERK